MTLTPRLRARIERDFGADADEVCELVAGASSEERMQAAIVLGSVGDVDQVRSVVGLADVDERDVLQFGGLGGSDWRERLDTVLDGKAPPTVAEPVEQRRYWRTWLVVLAVLLLGVLLPALIVGQFADQIARTSTADGVVTDNRYVVSKPPGHLCTYTYDVDGTTYEDSDRCHDEVAVGDRVEVRHRPGDPASSHVWSDQPLVYLAGGLVAWLVVAAVLVNHFRKRGRSG